jgi:hypothetical protein
MSETTHTPKPSVTYPPPKSKVEREAQRSSALTAMIELSKDERLLNEKAFLWPGANV